MKYIRNKEEHISKMENFNKLTGRWDAEGHGTVEVGICLILLVLIIFFIGLIGVTIFV